MKNYLKTSYDYLKTILFDDITIRYLFLAGLIFFVVDYLTWHFSLKGSELYIYLRIDLYPVKYLAIVFVINAFLAISSYNKEKEIAYLLLIGNIIVTVLIFALEIFYLTQ